MEVNQSNNQAPPCLPEKPPEGLGFAVRRVFRHEYFVISATVAVILYVGGLYKPINDNMIRYDERQSEMRKDIEKIEELLGNHVSHADERIEAIEGDIEEIKDDISSLIMLFKIANPELNYEP